MRRKILLRVLKEFDENLNMRDYLNTTMIDICKEENVSPNQVFSYFLFFFDVALIIIYGLLCFTIANQKLKMMLLIIR